MRGFLIVLILALVGGFLIKKWQPSETASVPFTGVWEIKDESDMRVGGPTIKTVHVKTDGKKFRLDSQVREDIYEYEEHVIYDGQMLHSKTIYLNQRDDFFAEEPKWESHTPRKQDLIAMRFWMDVIPSGAEAGPGGQVGGRDTTLYQFRERRKDREGNEKIWVDTETRVILKHTLSLYSKQAEILVTGQNVECQEITYGAVDPGAFLQD